MTRDLAPNENLMPSRGSGATQTFRLFHRILYGFHISILFFNPSVSHPSRRIKKSRLSYGIILKIDVILKIDHDDIIWCFINTFFYLCQNDRRINNSIRVVINIIWCSCPYVSLCIILCPYNCRYVVTYVYLSIYQYTYLKIY